MSHVTSLIFNLSVKLNCREAVARKLLHSYLFQERFERSKSGEIGTKPNFPMPVTLKHENKSFSFEIANQSSYDVIESYFDDIKDKEWTKVMNAGQYSPANKDWLTT
jgi:hypothetical protein